MPDPCQNGHLLFAADVVPGVLPMQAVKGSLTPGAVRDFRGAVASRARRIGDHEALRRIVSKAHLQRPSAWVSQYMCTTAGADSFWHETGRPVLIAPNPFRPRPFRAGEWRVRAR